MVLLKSKVKMSVLNWSHRVKIWDLLKGCMVCLQQNLGCHFVKNNSSIHSTALNSVSWAFVLFPQCRSWNHRPTGTTVTVLITFPPTVHVDSLFSTSSPALVSFSLFDFSHSNWGEVISHGFDWHLPDNLWFWAFFHVPIGHLYIFFWEMCI
jgi:hypothetical protein